MVNVKPSAGELFESDLVEGGRKIRFEIVVSKPQGSGPFPVIIFNHGSTGSGENKRFRKYTLAPLSVSNYFNDRGWMVVFPHRRGRGKSDGLYDEGFELDRSKYSCDPALSLPGVDRALEDIEVVTTYLANRADVIASRMIVAGVSRGGILSIDCAGQSETRFLAAINFNGGWLGRLCSTHEMVNREVFLRGATFSGPTLWLHGSRDNFYSLAQCKRNYEAFCEAGGKGCFVSLPAGHSLVFTPKIWVPHVDQFLSQIT
jgi:dienelactone hydrolase